MLASINADVRITRIRLRRYVISDSGRQKPSLHIIDTNEYLDTLTDRGNAVRIHMKHDEDVHYIDQYKKFIIWNGKHWEEDNTLQIEAFAKTVVL